MGRASINKESDRLSRELRELHQQPEPCLERMREGAAPRLPSLHQHRRPVCPLGLLRQVQGHSHPDGDHQILRDHRVRLHGRGDPAEGHHNQHHRPSLDHGELSLSPKTHLWLQD